MSGEKLPEKIHFGVIIEPHRAEVHTYNFPNIKPTDVVIKMERIHLCTTDYQQWMGLRNSQGFPMAAGHEFSGRICAKGEQVSKEFEIGMQVGSMSITCGNCEFCRRGQQSQCLVKKNKALNPDGYYGLKRFANYYVCDQKLLVPIADDIAPEKAACLEPLATAVRCAKKARIKPIEDVVVIGAGPMGILNALVAKAFGANVIITELIDKKLERARSLGVSAVIDAKEKDPVAEVKRITKGGAACVICAVGATAAYSQAYQMLRPYEGRVVIFPAGYPKPELNVDPNELHYKSHEIIGCYGADQGDWFDSAALISKKLVDPSFALEGKTFALRDIQKAYEAASIPGSYRVTINLQEI